ncbi:MAG: 30S ribosomal protein S6 [Thermoguttaceae bacterium]
MAENVYEGMIILNANRYGRDPEAVSGQVPQMINEAGGEMLVSRLWEERRLAYPIEGQRKGAYWLTYFRLDSGKLAEIRRKCQLSDSILRVLFLKVDPRIVDTLVAHATSGGQHTADDKKGGAETVAPATTDQEKTPETVAKTAEDNG